MGNKLPSHDFHLLSMSVDGFIESLGEVNIELESRFNSAVQNVFSDEMMNLFIIIHK